MCKLDALAELIFWGFAFIAIWLIANDSGALPLADQKGEWG